MPRESDDPKCSPDRPARKPESEQQDSPPMPDESAVDAASRRMGFPATVSGRQRDAASTVHVHETGGESRDQGGETRWRVQAGPGGGRRVASRTSRTLRVSRSGVKGLGRKSYAPFFIASTAELTVAKPVMTTTTMVESRA